MRVNEVIAVIVIGLLSVYMGLQAVTSLQKEKTRVHALSEELKEIQTLIEKCPDAQDKIIKAKSAAREFEKKICSERELPRVIQQLASSAQNLNIEIVSIRPLKGNVLKEDMPQGINKNYVEVVVKGSFKTLQDYLASLDKTSMILTVDAFNIVDLNHEVEAELIIGSYSLYD